MPIPGLHLPSTFTGSSSELRCGFLRVYSDDDTLVSGASTYMDIEGRLQSDEDDMAEVNKGMYQNMIASSLKTTHIFCHS